jgi:hypothetical protein
MAVKMYGPAFDESRGLVDRDVPEADVVAFENAGYVKGSLPEHLRPVKPNLALRGKLPEGFPGLAALNAAGITTYGQARKVDDWTTIAGVGPSNAAKIQAALAAKTDTEDE